jgi:hypothetical protein
MKNIFSLAIIILGLAIIGFSILTVLPDDSDDRVNVAGNTPRPTPTLSRRYDGETATPASTPTLLSYVLNHTPTPTATPTATPRPLTVIEHVPVSSGGMEVYPVPDAGSERIFAVQAGRFQPHVAGVNVTREWVFIVYFEADGSLSTGWARTRQVQLTDEEYLSLVEVDPYIQPALPEMEADDAATRP